MSREPTPEEKAETIKSDLLGAVIVGAVYLGYLWFTAEPPDPQSGFVVIQETPARVLEVLPADPR